MLNQLSNEQTEFPVKQITGKELDYYRMFKDDPDLYTKERTKIFKDDSDRFQERFNKWFPEGVSKELDIFRNSIKNKNLNIDEDLDDYLEILNTGRYLKDLE
jgi:transposase